MEKNRKRRNAFKRNLIAVAVASCFAGDLAVANPTGPTVVAGQASFQQAGTLLSITNSPSTIINWRGFSIGASEITRFIQQSAASAVLNRVTGGDLSTILGALQSNGRVFLVNPTGIVIGSGARIDVAGFVASTLNLPDADFLAGRMRFIETPNAGSIVNQGAINAASGGNVYLVAPEITNSGIITSSKGEVILAAGKSVELVNPGTPNLRVEIAAPDNQAINLGQIVADSGRAGIYAGIISNRGVIRADTIATGENGEILLRATKNITLEPGSVISASGAPGGVHDGGTVRIVADDTLDMQRGSAVRVDGGSDGGNGGFLELSGKQKIALNGEFTGRALKAGYKNGSLLLDPKNINIADPSVLATILAVAPNNLIPIVVSPDGSRVYTGGANGQPVTVIDTATNTVVATIPVAGAVALAIKPDGSRVYAVNQTSPGVPGTLSVIDTASNTVIATASTGYGSNHISMRPDGSKAYITNGNDNRLTVLDTATNTTAQVTIQGGPSVSAVTPNGNFVYANNGASSTVSVVDATTNTVTTTINVGSNPQWIVVRPDGARAYTANLSGNSVSVINTATNAVVATIGVGSQPRHIVISPDGSRLYVTNGAGNSISVIDTSTNTVVATVPVGTSPSAASISPDGSRVFVTNRTTDNVSIISTATNTVVNTVPVGDDPIFSAPKPDSSRVYVTNRLGQSVSVIGGLDTTGGDGTILFGDSPSATLTLAPSTLNGAWANVDLAANNDVSVNAVIASTDLPAGGALTLRAGRSVLINANITTNSNGNLTLLANDPSAVLGERDSGPGGITMAPGTTLNAGAGKATLTVGAGVAGAAGGDIVVENITAADIELQQNSPTNGSSILRASGSSLLTGTNLLMEVDHTGSATGGSIGIAAAPMRVQVSNLEAHTHEASPGIFVDSPTQGLTIGGVPFFGGAVKGVQNVVSGDISITANGNLTTQAPTALPAGCGLTGGTGGPVCTGSSITLAAGNGDLSIGSVVTHIGAGTGTLSARASNSILVAAGATITSGGGAFNVTLNADADEVGGGAIVMNGGSGITSNGGDIRLVGGIGGAGSAVGEGANVSGILLNGATLSSGAGSITLAGKAVGGTSNAHGINLTGGAQLTSTTGAITLTGTTGIGTTTNRGIRVSGASITSTGGLISVSGTSSSTGGHSNFGISISSGSTITATGGGIAIAGTGGSATGSNQYGVLVDGNVPPGPATTISANGADISITGTAGNGGGGFNRGVNIRDGAVVSTTGTGSINITGTGGSGTTSNVGIKVDGAGTTVSATGGTITLTGTGGTGTTNLYGVVVENSSAVTNTNGTITITGTAGNGSGGFNRGVNVRNGAVVSTTGTGNINITGTGGSGTTDNVGVKVDGVGTAVSAAGGTITLTGTGGTGTANLYGVLVENSGAVTNTTGPITITGTGTGASAGINLVGATITAGGDLALTAGGDVRIIPSFANPVTVSAGGDIQVSGVNFQVGSSGAVQQTTVTAGRDLIVGNHPDLGGGLPELTGTMLVRGGTAGNGGNASATVHANRNVFIKAGSVEIRGGSATAIENSFNTATADAELSAGNNLKLLTTSGGLTVAGGSATARASYSGATNNSATANANATLAATNSMTLEAGAGGVTVQGGDFAQASAYYTGPNIATANANASITAGTTLTLSAASLEVRGGDFARALASFGAPNTATANANATLSSGGDMMLTVGTGGVRVRGGDNAFAYASSGTSGLNTARVDANALVNSGGVLTLNVSGGGLTVRGGDNAVASNSSGNGLTTALVNVKSSMLANAMDLTVTDAVEIRGGNNAQALANCCNGSSAQNTATTTADALVRANNNLTLTINAGEGNSLTVAGGDNAKASGTEASGQSRNLTVNANAELSAGGNLTVIMNNQGAVTVRGGDRGSSGVAWASASPAALSVISTVNARGKMAAGGLAEIKGPAGLVTVRGGDDARASANGAEVAVTSATANVEGQITGASVKITASDLTVRGGNNASASASAYDNVGNTAIITANGLLNATSALDLIISGAMNVAGGNAAQAAARFAGVGNTNEASVSAGALVTGGNITISAGSLTVSGGVQGPFEAAEMMDLGINRATTLANANIVGTGNLVYTGGPVTLQGGTARTEGSTGSFNSATAQASAGIQVAGTKTLNVTGNLQILGGQALDSVVAPNTGSAVARAVLDPGALEATTTGDIIVSGGTVTGAGLAEAAVIAGGPLTLRAAGAGKSITVNNSASVTSGGGGDVTLLADEMEILGPVLNSSGFVNILPFTPTRDIHLGPSGPGAGVLALSNTELNNLSGGGGGGVVIGSISGASGNLVLTSPLTVSGNLALLAGNGMTIDRSITVQGGGSLVLNAGAGDLNILPSISPTRVESLDMALLGANVNVGGASGTQSTTVLANGLLIVGAASNFTVRGGMEAGAFTSVGGGGLTTIVTLGDVIVAGGGGSNASATVSGTPDVDMVVGGEVRLDAGAGAGASAAIMAGSATSIHLDLPNLGSGGFFVNGQEGVVHDPATATGFFAGGAPAVLGQSLLVTYGVSPPPSSLPGVVLQAINTTVQSTTEAGSTGEDSGTLRGERTASQGAGPDEEQKEKEKEEKARPVCN